MKYQRLAALSLLLVFSGCAHSHRSGSVLHLEEDGSAHVCLPGEVEKGDRLDVYDIRCDSRIESSATRARPVTNCQKTPAGAAKVVEVSDDDFSRVAPEGKTVLKKGQIVELKR